MRLWTTKRSQRLKKDRQISTKQPPVALNDQGEAKLLEERVRGAYRLGGDVHSDGDTQKYYAKPQHTKQKKQHIQQSPNYVVLSEAPIY